MASLHLGAASLINESRVFLGSSLKLRIGFRSKRLRRVAERWRFRVKSQMTKHELVRFASRSESLLYILKQYGISVEKLEENKTSDGLDDRGFVEKHADVPSVVDDSKMNTTEELPQENYRETVSTAEKLSGQLRHLNTGAMFTCLLPVLGFCIVCIIGTLHRIISSRTLEDHHHHGSKRTRWRTALSDSNEPLASDDHEYKDGSVNEEATDEAYSKVELEYKRFLLECGVSES